MLLRFFCLRAGAILQIRRDKVETMTNEMLTREVANISTDVLSGLGKLVSAYKEYTETLAAVQKQIEYTKEYKEKQTQTARENLVRKTAGTCNTIKIQLESLEDTVNSLDQTLSVADPELMPCVGLLANSPEALPLELIGSVAEKFKGNRLALLALAAVAKENNKSFLEGKAVDGSGAVKQIRNKFDTLADGYPKTLHLLPEVKNDLVKLCEAYGHEIGDAADTYLGADYGDIVNLIMREAAGL